MRHIFFLGAKAPLGLLQFVKDKPKSSKIEGCCWICKNTVFIARNSNKFYAKGQGGIQVCFMDVQRVGQGCFRGISWVFYGIFSMFLGVFSYIKWNVLRFVQCPGNLYGYFLSIQDCLCCFRDVCLRMFWGCFNVVSTFFSGVF